MFLTKKLDLKYANKYKKNKKLYIKKDEHKVKTSSATKQAAIERLIYYFEKEHITLPNDPDIKQEFLDFKRKGQKLTAKSGSHDDLNFFISCQVLSSTYTEYVC